MTAPWPPPLSLPAVAGVSGGVGTSTVARALNASLPNGAIDIGLAMDARADFLVMSMMAASAARLPAALRAFAAAGRRPVLIVSHTAAGGTPQFTKSQLRAAMPHVTDVIHLPHALPWLEQPTPPGPSPLPRPVAQAVRAMCAHWEHP